MAQLQKIPVMLYTQDLPPSVNSMITGQIDFMPTILNLLGIKSSFCLGKDMLNTKYGYVVLRNGSVITDDFTYVSSEKIVYDLLGNPIDSPKFNDILENLQKDITISDLILIKDYFSTIDS